VSYFSKPLSRMGEGFGVRALPQKASPSIFLWGGEEIPGLGRAGLSIFLWGGEEIPGLVDW